MGLTAGAYLSGTTLVSKALLFSGIVTAKDGGEGHQREERPGNKGVSKLHERRHGMQ